MTTTLSILRAHASITLRATLVLLAAAALPTARAECFVDSFGRERCTLSNGARIGIAIGVIVAFIILALGIGMMRRRRIQRANMAYIVTQQQQAQTDPYGNQYLYGNTGSQYPQYPPGGQSYHNQQGYTPYSPPQGPPPPPQYDGYNPPRNPPPAKV
ncbi:hypothetical protein EW145_g3131 [Phellinidium pouzarii]|uniref:Uncharacterized protein n=1 Tax=Phellinidium pouzarii TaxID=167371 RepID=A0A4S4L9R9_9AGAM|nr:hypothetical protein EW145_g3131 [Phellinidium pouzarii]